MQDEEAERHSWYGNIAVAHNCGQEPMLLVRAGAEVGTKLSLESASEAGGNFMSAEVI
jgi:hypothetical protein